MVLDFARLNGQSGHEAGRQLLAQLYQQKAGKALPEIAVTPLGKPYFPGENLHFSISHTKTHAFCVLSEKNVGLDAENMDRVLNSSLADKFLSPSEREKYLAAPDKNAALLRLWVLKEAYAKGTGKGLGNYLKNTDFDPFDPRIQVIDGCFIAVLEAEGERYAL